VEHEQAPEALTAFVSARATEIAVPCLWRGAAGASGACSGWSGTDAGTEALGMHVLAQE
jgi:hypothetical protein